MSEMNLRQIMLTTCSVENKLTSLSSNDAKVGQKFSNTQLQSAQKLKSSLDDNIKLAKEQQYDGTVSTIVTGALSGVAALGCGSGLAFSGSSMAAVGSVGSTVQQLAANVAAPIAQAGVGIAKAQLDEKQGANIEAQVETAGAMKSAGNIADESIDQASSLTDDRSKESGDMLGALRGENGASNY